MPMTLINDRYKTKSQPEPLNSKPETHTTSLPQNLQSFKEKLFPGNGLIVYK